MFGDEKLKRSLFHLEMYNILSAFDSGTVDANETNRKLLALCVATSDDIDKVVKRYKNVSVSADEQKEILRTLRKEKYEGVFESHTDLEYIEKLGDIDKLISFIKEGEVIKAIKEFRALDGCGLKEAKCFIEDFTYAKKNNEKKIKERQEKVNEPPF